MKCQPTVADCRLRVARTKSAMSMIGHSQSSAKKPAAAFTLVELLVVISILGLIAGIAVPALKDLGKANTQISAARQLLDEVGRARQLAMSQHTTVYMVFVPTNFWGNTTWFNNLTPNQLKAYTNVLDKQLTGYAFIAAGQPGDQPGQHSWHYLSTWQSLPQGAFISPNKFLPATSPLLPMQIPQWQADFPHPNNNYIYNFPVKYFPFPTEDAGVNGQISTNLMPYIAFNYLGQLSVNVPQLSSLDEYIPLVQGVVGYGVDPTTKQPTATIVNPSDIVERPPGNSTGVGYNIVHIDALTGRATLEFFKIK